MNSQLRTVQMTLPTKWVICCNVRRPAPEAHEVVGKLRKGSFCFTGGAHLVFKSSKTALRGGWLGDQRCLGPDIPPDACWGLRRGQPYGANIQTGLSICSHLKNGPRELPSASLALRRHLGVCISQDDVNKGDKRSGDLEPYRNPSSGCRCCWWRVAPQLASCSCARLCAISLSGPLTGLVHRRFMEDIWPELPRAKAQDLSLVSSYVVSIHFKRFNDIHGHDGRRYSARLHGGPLSATLPS